MTPDSPKILDGLTPHQLIDEVRQMAEQYSREVSTARRTWPKSIHLRIIALGRLGIPKQRIAKLCGIPPATVFLWCRGLRGRRSQKARSTADSPRFVSLPATVTPQLAPTVGVTVTDPLPAPTGLYIRMPDGIEVRGLTSVAQVVELYRGIHSQ